MPFGDKNNVDTESRSLSAKRRFPIIGGCLKLPNVQVHFTLIMYVGGKLSDDCHMIIGMKFVCCLAHLHIVKLNRQ